MITNIYIKIIKRNLKKKLLKKLFNSKNDLKKYLVVFFLEKFFFQNPKKYI